MSHYQLTVTKKAVLAKKQPFRRSKVLLNKRCNLKVNDTLKDCACHQPKHAYHFPVNECYRIVDGAKPQIKLRLAGINNNFNFELFRHQGNRVILEVAVGEKVEKIRGTLCQVGTDYVDIKKEDGKIVTVLQSNIQKVEWLGRRKRAPRMVYVENHYHDGHHGYDEEDNEE